MNRSNIVARLSELYPKISRKEIDGLVRDILGLVTKNIISGKRVEIRGFGCFSLKARQAGTVRNPREGINIPSKQRHVVYFRPGKNLKERVNQCFR